MQVAKPDRCAARIPETGSTVVPTIRTAGVGEVDGCGNRITSREFNRDVSAAMRAAQLGPVTITITNHGRPSHVLLTAEEYERLAHASEKLGDRI